MLTLRQTVLPLVAVSVFALGGCQTRAPLKAEADGVVAIKAGDYVKAEEDFAYVLDKSPGRVPSRIGMAQALLGQSKTAQARTHLEAAYSIDPQNDQVIDLLAEAMLKDGKTDEMTRLLRGRAEDLRTVPEWLRYGKWAQRAGDMDDAKAALLTAARIDKGRTFEPQSALADFYLTTGDTDRALQRLRMALYLRPQDKLTRDRLAALGKQSDQSYAIVPTEALGQD